MTPPAGNDEPVDDNEASNGAGGAAELVDTRLTAGNVAGTTCGLVISMFYRSGEILELLLKTMYVKILQNGSKINF